jgi:hypothetical protein
MGVRDLRLMRGMCMIVILEMFRGFVMIPRCLFVMVRCATVRQCPFYPTFTAVTGVESPWGHQLNQCLINSASRPVGPSVQVMANEQPWTFLDGSTFGQHIPWRFDDSRA